jgi:hypothetical protein
MKRADAFLDTPARKTVLVSIITTAIVMALSGLLVTASPPASAAGGLLIRETSGQYKIGAPTLQIFDPVQETTSGRLIDVFPLGGHRIELELATDQSKCVAASNGGKTAVLHLCSGAAVAWDVSDLNSDGSCLISNAAFPNAYLSGDDMGDQFQLKAKKAKGWFQRFTFSDAGLDIICPGAVAS